MDLISHKEIIADFGCCTRILKRKTGEKKMINAIIKIGIIILAVVALIYAITLITAWV